MTGSPVEADARAEQRRLARLVRLTPAQELPEVICGVDVSYSTGSGSMVGSDTTGDTVRTPDDGTDGVTDGGLAVAAAVVVDVATHDVVDQATTVGRPGFPYVPGLLSFRELPLILDALGKLETLPPMVVADGHGYAHPARFGLACHLGVEIDRPTIGCAKTPFVGGHGEPGPDRGAWADIIDGDEVIGSVLRTRAEVKPVYVSPGHLIDLPSARAAILALTGRYRLPETTRGADQLSRRVLADLGRR